MIERLARLIDKSDRIEAGAADYPVAWQACNPFHCRITGDEHALAVQNQNARLQPLRASLIQRGTVAAVTVHRDFGGACGLS